LAHQSDREHVEKQPISFGTNNAAKKSKIVEQRSARQSDRSKDRESWLYRNAGRSRSVLVHPRLDKEDAAFKKPSNAAPSFLLLFLALRYSLFSG